jgi:hypothetical protein
LEEVRESHLLDQTFILHLLVFATANLNTKDLDDATVHTLFAFLDMFELLGGLLPPLLDQFLRSVKTAVIECAGHNIAHGYGDSLVLEYTDAIVIEEFQTHQTPLLEVYGSHREFDS